MNTDFSYDKMDYYNILEYLKSQAEYFSNGEWTDFSDADIGTVILKLMAMNADTTNYQIEKGISELYLDTVIERVNAVALCKLIGYEPRHYQSASVDLIAIYNGDASDSLVLPAFSSFSNSTGSLKFYTLEDYSIVQGINNIKAYQGQLISKQYNFSDINEDGRLILDEYNIGTNTVRVSQAGYNMTHVDNALYGEGESCFSVHINLDNKLYIQFPTYYKTIISNSAPIEVNYLLSDGINGRVGSNVITGTYTLSNGFNITYTNDVASEGGYDPETVEEIRKSAPSFASTMDTLVTLNDFRILSNDFSGVADVSALDYNYPESGLIQPTDDQVNDAYKVNLYILPENADNIYKEIEEPDITGMDLLTPDDFIIEENDVVYTFDYDYNDGFFYNTNTNVNDSSCIIGLFPKIAYKKMIIKYETNTEYRYDYFYLDVNNTNKVKLSGENNGSLLLEDTLEDTYIKLSYIKDTTSVIQDDFVKVYIYATNDESLAPIYSNEYLDEIKIYIDDVRKKKPAGIKVDYFNVDYIRPLLTMKVYMDEDDLRYNSAGVMIANYLEELYSRKTHKIGDAIYQSHISRDVLSAFDYVKYLEIISLTESVDGAIKPNRKQYVELLASNITVKVVPYEES